MLPALLPWQRRARALLGREGVRVLVLLCGRQAGKSRVATALALEAAYNGKRVWWIAPSYPIAESVGWDTLRVLVAGVPGVRLIASRRMIRFPGGGWIQVKTADNPDGLRGSTLDLVILDEAAYMPERVWIESVRPALARRRGKAILATTPAGQNWVYSLFMRAGADPEIAALRVKTEDNPTIPREEIEAARQRTPASLFAQEWEAEPMSGDDGVIPLAWVRLAVERWKAWKADGGKRPEGTLYLGVDVSEGGGDLTTFAHRVGPVVTHLSDHTPRMRGDMMPIGDAAIVALKTHEGQAYAIIDSVGSGAMLPSMLRREGCTALSFKAGGSTKLRDASGEFGFANLRSAAWWNAREMLNPEHSEIALPDDPDLIQELTAPRYVVQAGARLAVESKDQIRKRIGRSTDKADAVIQSMWTRTLMK